MVKIHLTETQKKVVDMYVKEGLTQEQIAIKIYNNKYRQGDVSQILRLASQTLGIPITKIHNKGKKYVPVERNDYL